MYNWTWIGGLARLLARRVWTWKQAAGSFCVGIGRRQSAGVITGCNVGIDFLNVALSMHPNWEVGCEMSNFGFLVLSRVQSGSQRRLDERREQAQRLRQAAR